MCQGDAGQRRLCTPEQQHSAGLGHALGNLDNLMIRGSATCHRIHLSARGWPPVPRTGSVTPGTGPRGLPRRACRWRWGGRPPGTSAAANQLPRSTAHQTRRGGRRSPQPRKRECIPRPRPPPRWRRGAGRQCAGSRRHARRTAVVWVLQREVARSSSRRPRPEPGANAPGSRAPPRVARRRPRQEGLRSRGVEGGGHPGPDDRESAYPAR